MTVKEFIDFYKASFAFANLDDFSVSMCVSEKTRPNDVLVEIDHADKKIYIAKSDEIEFSNDKTSQIINKNKKVFP
jgi:hypothetical protein